MRSRPTQHSAKSIQPGEGEDLRVKDRETHSVPTTSTSTLFVCGVNQDRAAIGVREKFALAPERCLQTLERLRNEGLAGEALVLSTCNRTEIYVYSPLEENFIETLREFFLSLAGGKLEPDHVPPLYNYEDLEAVRHFFAVEAGLDSMILGENEIKSQVGQAYEMSKQTGMAGANLHRLIEAANRCSKRIRTETDLNVGTLSVAKAATLRAEQILGSFEGKVCVVIGAGKVGRVAAEAIAERRPAKLLIVNRTVEKAQEVARGLNAEIVPIPQMAPAIRQADLILGAAFAPNFLVTRAMFESLRGPGSENRRVCLIDAAVPRILDHAIGSIPGVTLLDISHLEGIIAENRAKRTAAAQKAWELIEQEIEKFRSKLQAVSLAPALERLKKHFDEVFDEIQTDMERDLSESSREKIRAAQHRLKQRLLHLSMQELKNHHRGD